MTEAAVDNTVVSEGYHNPVQNRDALTDRHSVTFPGGCALDVRSWKRIRRRRGSAVPSRSFPGRRWAGFSEEESLAVRW